MFFSLQRQISYSHTFLLQPVDLVPDGIIAVFGGGIGVCMNKVELKNQLDIRADL